MKTNEKKMMASTPYIKEAFLNYPMASKWLMACLMVMVFCFSGCSKEAIDKQKKTFVLVHGAWQSAYVWSTVKTNH